ncbi:hypothetical protein AB0M02_45940, partial [Actinoplanes sp. NPDC051861]
MNTTTLLSAPITLDRRLLLGETEYQVTVFPTDDRRLDLCIVSSDGDGQVVSEISGGISPADLPALTDVLSSTLAGLIAMTRQPGRVSALGFRLATALFGSAGIEWNLTAASDSER